MTTKKAVFHLADSDESTREGRNKRDVPSSPEMDPSDYLREQLVASKRWLAVMETKRHIREAAEILGQVEYKGVSENLLVYVQPSDSLVEPTRKLIEHMKGAPLSDFQFNTLMKLGTRRIDKLYGVIDQLTQNIKRFPSISRVLGSDFRDFYTRWSEMEERVIAPRYEVRGGAFDKYAEKWRDVMAVKYWEAVVHETLATYETLLEDLSVQMRTCRRAR